jgi:hypothetical protein
VLELSREIGDVSASILSNDEHLPEVGLGLDVTLESVLVSTLFLADLTVPSQPLKSFGLHRVGEVLGRSNCGPL